MIAIAGIQQQAIRRHYQLGTVFYRLLWGPHIHHGLWQGNESAYAAQCQLTDTLAELARLSAGDRVVDIGCGMGGSAIRLARQRGCDVAGVTLSPVQCRWAQLAALSQGVAKRTRFRVEDADKIAFDSATLDVVWSVECTEHLFNKAGFFQRAATWLRPGGRIAICVWFEGEDTSRPGHREQCEQVCRRFVCPSLGTREDYAGWMCEQGMRVTHSIDWTDRVTRTWEICKSRVERTGIRHLLQLLGREHVEFIDGFDLLLDAYRSGAMQYGTIVAEKPRG